MSADDGRMPRWVALPLLAGAAIFLFSNGAIVGYGMGHDRAFSSWNFGAQLAPDPTFPDIFAVHRLFPMDARLSIVPRAEFDRLAALEDVLAFTYVNQRPCRIVLPADWRIAYRPSAKVAFWDPNDPVSDAAADIIAHEILHCQIGTWHPEP